MIGVLAVCCWLVAVQPTPLSPVGGTGTEAELSKAGDGRLQLALRADFDALLLGIGSTTPLEQRVRAMESLRGEDLEAAIERLKRYLQRRVRIRFDDQAAPLTVSFPELRYGIDGVRLLTLGNESRLLCTIPQGARSVTFFASRSFGPVTLRGFAGPGGRRQQIRLEAGQTSPPLGIPP